MAKNDVRIKDLEASNAALAKENRDLRSNRGSLLSQLEQSTQTTWDLRDEVEAWKKRYINLFEVVTKMGITVVDGENITAGPGGKTVKISR